MAFVKKYLIIVISSAVALLAIVAIVLGRWNLAQSADLLKPADRFILSIKTIRAGVTVKTQDGKTVKLVPTEALVKKVKARSSTGDNTGLEAKRAALHKDIGFDPATGKFRRKTLIKGVFPETTNLASFTFKSRYRAAIDELLATLDAGGAATAEDADRELSNLKQDLGTSIFGILKSGKSAGGGGAGSSGTSDQGFTHIAWQKAVIGGAEKIHIYATVDLLDVDLDMYTAQSGTPPSLGRMWRAQVSLWLQQDIVRAIAEVNNTENKEGNVGDSVVKRILKIQIQQPGDPESLGRGFALQESFTGLTSPDNYDVARFLLEVIVDVRQIPKLKEAIYKQGHYLLYHFEIQELDVERAAAGRTGGGDDVELYRYGPAPVVRLVSYWEAYLLRDFYHWGIVDYGEDAKGEFILTYDTAAEEFLREQASKRAATGPDGLRGLMPKELREILSAPPDRGAGRGGRGRVRSSGGRRGGVAPSPRR